MTDTALGAARCHDEAIRFFPKNLMKGCETLGMNSIIIGKNEQHLGVASELPGNAARTQIVCQGFASLRRR
jgi:hypothetical protein